ATQQQLAPIIHEHRGMYRSAVLAKGLESTDALAQAVEPGNRRQWRPRQYFQVWQCLLDRLHSAQPATAGSGQLPALLLEVPECTVGDSDLRVLRRAGAAELQVVDVGGVVDDAAAEAETDDEVFQVGWSHQHHGLA